MSQKESEYIERALVAAIEGDRETTKRLLDCISGDREEGRLRVLEVLHSAEETVLGIEAHAVPLNRGVVRVYSRAEDRKLQDADREAENGGVLDRNRSRLKFLDENGAKP